MGKKHKKKPFIQDYSAPEIVYESKLNRWIIVNSKTKKVLDDGNGYGYKTKDSAQKVIWYKQRQYKMATDSEFRKKQQDINDNIKKMLDEHPKILERIDSELYFCFVDMKEGTIDDYEPDYYSPEHIISRATKAENVRIIKDYGVNIYQIKRYLTEKGIF